ncbi:MAG: alpha-glucan family phosphorylase [Chitinophagaceae bacterium]|nr:alpha-glucan family phosphorylase [Chitinophagaceae bacterium]
MDATFSKDVYGMLPEGIQGIELLAHLALDLRWSWNHATDQLWEDLDAELWEQTHNPWVVLQTVSRARLKERMEDLVFLKKVKKFFSTQEKIELSDAWFQINYPDSKLKTVAFFSMEYMLSEALPVYAGGLGNVSGDQLKSASDLGIPVVGIGLLYQQGYFRQQIDRYGSQQALFPFNDPGQLPITPLRLPDGEWLRFQVYLSGHPVWVRVWQVHVGRIRLYLMDSNDPANLPAHRGITSETYGGDAELRIRQEILLGIGGFKLLQVLKIHPEVCHLNEGHSAFLVLERASQFMKDNGVPFETALTATRAGNIFTTHTAVDAGFDHFSPALMEQYFCDYAVKEISIDFKELMALGRKNKYNQDEYFNTAILAINGSNFVNGVSQLHGKVSRKLFSTLFPRWPMDEIPVEHITNGVHMPTWDSELADHLWTEACGKERWRGELKDNKKNIAEVSDEALWDFRNKSRKKLVTWIRKRFQTQSRISGLPFTFPDQADKIFDPNVLTLGFARRFVPYKRTNLLLRDPGRLIRILTGSQFPVQLVIAGKASPFDERGKSLVREWNQFIQQNNLFQHVVFLSDSDMQLTAELVQGVDIWINTPRRPWEACGTSGMKVLVNGGVNLSVLDGWWAEAYSPEVGWALGNGEEHSDNNTWDAIEADELYDLIEQQIAPEFYERNEKGIPEKWVNRSRNSMAKLTSHFSANRAVREYTERFYLNAASEYLKRAEQKGAGANGIIDIKNDLHSKWDSLKIGEVKVKKNEKGFFFQVPVYMDEGIRDKICVELFADGEHNKNHELIKMNAVSPAENNYSQIYQAQVFTERDANDFTVRVIPKYGNIKVPLEDNQILWER